MQSKTTVLYKLSILMMLLITGAVFVMTLLHIRSESVFQGPFTVILLAGMMVLTAVCICLETPKGNRLYKCGFFILHGGLVILLCGFIISSFLGTSYSVTIPVGGNSYGSVQNEDGTLTQFGFYIGVTNASTEYYTDENGMPTRSPKQYNATVSVTDGKTAEVHTESLTVNHPIRIQGNRSYKVYLMSFGTSPDTGEYCASLLMKSDPAEYTILAGIALLLLGSVLMCLIAPISFGKKKNGDKIDAAALKGKEKRKI